MNEVNGSLVSPLPEHVSSCSSGNNSKRELTILQLQTAREFLNKPILDPEGFVVPKRPKKVASLGAVDLIMLFR
jgi:hypothetical protein